MRVIVIIIISIINLFKICCLVFGISCAATLKKKQISLIFVHCKQKYNFFYFFFWYIWLIINYFLQIWYQIFQSINQYELKDNQMTCFGYVGNKTMQIFHVNRRAGKILEFKTGGFLEKFNACILSVQILYMHPLHIHTISMKVNFFLVRKSNF